MIRYYSSYFVDIIGLLGSNDYFRRRVNGIKSWLAHTEIENELNFEDISGEVNSGLELDMEVVSSYNNGTGTSTLTIYEIGIEEGEIEYYCHVLFAPKISEIAETVDSTGISIMVMGQ